MASGEYFPRFQPMVMCSVTFREVMWRYRYAVAVYAALCTQSFFRLGILAWFEFVYGVVSTFCWVGQMVGTTLVMAMLENLDELVVMGATGYGVLYTINRINT